MHARLGTMNGTDVHEQIPIDAPVFVPALPRQRPTRADAEAAVATLIRRAGDDPDRPGLVDTPRRVVRAYEEWFSGYHQDPVELLERTFDEIGSYDEPVELHGIGFHSFCEHHMAGIAQHGLPFGQCRGHHPHCRNRTQTAAPTSHRKSYR